MFERYFERLTGGARQALVLAEEEAGSLHHDYVRTDDVLLRLIREDQGVAARALASLGVTVDAGRQEARGIVGEAELGPSRDIPGCTHRAQKVLKLSIREALKLGHGSIGTEDVLLGLISRGWRGGGSGASAASGNVRPVVITHEHASVRFDGVTGAATVDLRPSTPSSGTAGDGHRDC